MSTDIIHGTIITRICGQRDASVRMMDEAIDLINRGTEQAKAAREMANSASSGTVFSLVDRSKDDAYKRLFHSIDAARSSEVFRHHTDAAVWLHLMRVTGMETLMDVTARDEFFAQLSSEVPEVNEDNVRVTLQGLRGDAKLIFQRGLARVFSDLDRRFKSHDAFKIGSRIILTNIFDSWGSWNYHSHARATFCDIERVLAVLDGKEPEPGELQAAVDESRGNSWEARQGVCETRYLRIRTFKNGNAHLWFTRPDLTRKANLVLAEYYGEVLPDGVPGDDQSIKTKSGLPAKNLSYYPTPAPVVKALLHDLYLGDGARTLEPSAGTGHIAIELVALGYEVDAIEVDPERCRELSRIQGVRATCGNFLRRPALPIYDAVIMNPPFYGTHWMEHVVHAFDWLKPGGILRSVLPVTAEVGSSKKHEAFRIWASKRSRSSYRDGFSDLPAESFASSGTRINTVILELRKALQ